MTSKRTATKAKEATMTGFAILSSKTFGPFSRYRLDECRTRFGTTTFMVADSEKADDLTGLPAIIRQADTMQQAVAGLEAR